MADRCSLLEVYSKRCFQQTATGSPFKKDLDRRAVR